MNVTRDAAAGMAAVFKDGLHGDVAGSSRSSSGGSIGIDYLYSMPVEYEEPAYFRPRPSLLPWISDKYLSLLTPIVVYWVVSLWFQFLDTAQIPFFEKYRLHEPQEISKRNRVSARRVVAMVAIQQVVQTFVGMFVLEDEQMVLQQVFADHQGNVKIIAQRVASVAVAIAGRKNGIHAVLLCGPRFANWLYWWGIPTAQFVWAFFVMDAWQYILHRAFHESRFLYNHFHSHHHRLYVPYAFGALYNHPVEGLLLDSGGGALSHAAAFMTIRQGILLFGFSTLKTVCDHGGYAFPVWLDPLHLIFPNTAEYHDVHHQMQGLRYNFSQPFFIHFDVVFGTRMSAEKFAKMRATNQRLKDGRKANGKVEAAVDAKTNGGPHGAEPAGKTKSMIADRATDALRRRTAAGVAIDTDKSPEEIALDQGSNGDATVTTNLASYRAKEGTTA